MRMSLSAEGMKKMLQYLNTLMALKRDEKGVTALEYGLIAALITAVIVTAVNTLESNLSATFTNIAGHLRPTGS